MRTSEVFSTLLMVLHFGFDVDLSFVCHRLCNFLRRQGTFFLDAFSQVLTIPRSTACERLPLHSVPTSRAPSFPMIEGDFPPLAGVLEFEPFPFILGQVAIGTF